MRNTLPPGGTAAGTGWAGAAVTSMACLDVAFFAKGPRPAKAAGPDGSGIYLQPIFQKISTEHPI
jgi:hypothetical protein